VAQPTWKPHIRLRGTSESKAYAAVSEGGGGAKAPQYPQRARGTHGLALRQQLDQLQARETRLVAARLARGFTATGSTVAVEVELNPDFKPESLEDAKSGVELLMFHPQGDNKGVAAIHVPNGKLSAPKRKVDRYLDSTKDSTSGEPRHAPLLSSIDRFRAPRCRDLWTDPVYAFPDDERTEHWWEVWLRGGMPDGFREQARRLGISVGKQELRFRERWVVIARATLAAMEDATDLLDCVAELRAAPSLDAEFHSMAGPEQAEWVRETGERLLEADGAIAVCLLDTGVAWTHPLLAPAIREEDCHAYARWPRADWHGHGTEMAGLACYGEHLGDALAASTGFRPPLRLESVNVLHASASDAALRLRGEILKTAVATVEIARPGRSRLFSFTITGAPSSKGRPTAWSAALDDVCAGSDDEPRRLVFVAVGNTHIADSYAYPESNFASPVQDPAQGWNAVAVGATTYRTRFANRSGEKWDGWSALAPPGDLSPHSTTARFWEAKQWPNKPDMVMEGGNLATDPAKGATADPEELCLLTTHRPQIGKAPLTSTSGTSAAVTLAARQAAAVAKAYPELWPETIRALMTHSCRWTEAMRARCHEGSARARMKDLIATFGYGVPDEQRALHSAGHALTMIVEDTIRPFQLDDKGQAKTNEMRLHRLPWPDDALMALGDTEVRLKVTLSYFIEPNPGERGWKSRYRYPSHGLRFAVKTAEETDAEFEKRINQAVREKGEKGFPSDTSEWEVGPELRNRGSLHSDTWSGLATRLAGRGRVAVFPTIGWWRERRHLGQVERTARYSLVVSIETDEVEVAVDGLAIPVDFYSEVESQVESSTEVELETS